MDDFGAMPEHAPHPATLSTNKCGNAGSYQASVESFYHKEPSTAEPQPKNELAAKDHKDPKEKTT